MKRVLLAALRPLLLVTGISMLSVISVVWLLSGFMAPGLGMLLRLLVIPLLLTSIAGVAWWYHRRKTSWRTVQEKKTTLTDLERDKTALASLFGDAIKQLKNRQRLATRSLYEQAWYVALGDGRSGKSTLLSSNNLEPLFLYSKDEETSANWLCRFWVGERVVVIETGPGLVGASVNEALWHYFADLLMKYRPRQALNGLIMVISCADLLNGSRDGRRNLASRIREAILTLNNRIGIQLPVYATFSCVDAIRDFLPAFSSRREGGADTPFGDLVEQYDNRHFDVEWFRHSLQTLLLGLVDKQLRSMQQGRRPESWQSLIALPFQLQLFGRVMENFCKDLCTESLLREYVWLRGYFLFTSEQQGAQYDLLTQAVSNFGGCASTTAYDQVPGRMTLFASRLLQQVILPESGIAGRNRQQESRYLFAHLLVILVLVLSLGVFIYQMRANWIRDESYFHSMQSRLALYHSEIFRLERQERTTDLAYVLPVLTDLRQLYLEGNRKKPWYLRSSLFEGNLSKAVTQAYHNHLQQLLLPRLIDLTAIALQQSLDDDDTGQVFEHLRFYLMLFNKRLLNTSGLKRFLLGRMAVFVPQLNGHQAEQLVSELLDSEYAAVYKPREPLVEMARQSLAGVPVDQLIYGRLKALPDNRETLDVRHFMGKYFPLMARFRPGFKAFTLPVMYTAMGYANLDLSVKSPLLRQLLTEYRLIMGDLQGPFNVDLLALSTNIQNLYFSDYIYRWKNLYDNIEVAHFDTLIQLCTSLEVLRAPSISPLLDALNFLVANTQLVQTREPLETSVIEKTAGKAGRQGAKWLASDQQYRLHPAYVVDEQFQQYADFVETRHEQGAAFERLEHCVSNLDVYLQDALTAPDPGEVFFTYALAHAAGNNDPIRCIDTVSTLAPSVVASIGQALSQQIWKLVLMEAYRHIDKQWRQNVLPVYKSTLAGRFPFAVSEGWESSLSAFVTFFRPEGVWDGFMTTYLAPFIDWQGAKPVVKSIDGFRLPLKPQVLDLMIKAKRIRYVYLDANGQQLSLDLTVRALDMSPDVTDFILFAARPIFKYQHGPRVWGSLHWPTDDTPDTGVTAQFFRSGVLLAEKQYNGPWALLRFFWDARMKADTMGVIFEYSLGDRSIKLHGSAIDEYPGPRAQELFLNFNLPETLL